MLLEIANTDRVIQITPTGAATWTPGTPAYTDTLSTPVKAGNGLPKQIVVSRITWGILAAPAPGACTKVGYNFGGGGAWNPISPTGTKVKETDIGMGWDGMPIRRTDKGNCMGVFSNPNPPFDFVFCTCDFVVKDAGQIKVKCQ